MMIDTPQVILQICLGIGIGILIGILYAKITHLGKVRRIRKQAVQQSRSTTLGYVSEKVAPLLPEFPYSYKDMTFLGKGVDYIVFDGLSEGYVRKIVFLEVKSGKSRLNKNEKLIRDAVEKRSVSYDIYRM